MKGFLGEGAQLASPSPHLFILFVLRAHPWQRVRRQLLAIRPHTWPPLSHTLFTPLPRMYVSGSWYSGRYSRVYVATCPTQVRTRDRQRNLAFSAHKLHMLLMAAVGVAAAGWRAMHTAHSQTATCLCPLLHTTINPQFGVSCTPGQPPHHPPSLPFSHDPTSPPTTDHSSPSPPHLAHHPSTPPAPSPHPSYPTPDSSP